MKTPENVTRYDLMYNDYDEAGMDVCYKGGDFILYEDFKETYEELSIEIARLEGSLAAYVPFLEDLINQMHQHPLEL